MTSENPSGDTSDGATAATADAAADTASPDEPLGPDMSMMDTETKTGEPVGLQADPAMMDEVHLSGHGQAMTGQQPNEPEHR